MSQVQKPEVKKDFKYWVDKAVSVGAAVVIVGALFKILHWPFANTLLIVGMFTEAAIFLVYAYLPSDPQDHSQDGVSSATLDSTDLINALKEVKQSIEDTNKNLGALASQTEGLKNINAKFETMGKTIDELNHFYGSVKTLTESMTNSVGDAARTKDQLNALANNLTELNGVYANMINAIKGK
jgi:uncharacterized protein YoxC